MKGGLAATLEARAARATKEREKYIVDKANDCENGGRRKDGRQEEAGFYKFFIFETSV